MASDTSPIHMTRTHTHTSALLFPRMRPLKSDMVTMLSVNRSAAPHAAQFMARWLTVLVSMVSGMISDEGGALNVRDNLFLLKRFRLSKCRAKTFGQM